jgi:8-oxo-dGTP pyrophosphatase MutT (NUDIX family)
MSFVSRLERFYPPFARNTRDGGGARPADADAVRYPVSLGVRRMKRATICFLVDDRSCRVLLGLKKRGFGEGKYNGFGGKIADGEDVGDSAVREIREECGLEVDRADLVPAGRLVFYFPFRPEFDHDASVFRVGRWQGEPRESDEMQPQWFPIREIPFHRMWQDDAHWLPLVLDGASVEAEFTFADDNETVSRFSLRTTPETQP